MNKTIVIGGGFAGLATSVFLSGNNHNVKLLEASPRAGGRAYSFYEPSFGCSIDNGQHLLMGCYYETIEFLKTIGSLDKLDFPGRLDAAFVKRNGEVHRLSARGGFYPLNLLRALLNYTAIGFKDRLKILDFVMDLICCIEEDIADLTAAQWLSIKGQDAGPVKAFWDILIIGALNTTADKASAAVLANVLKQMFLSGKTASSLLVPGTDLSDLYVNDSIKYLEQKGSEIRLSERVIKFNTNAGRITEIITNKTAYNDFDSVVTAVPMHALVKFMPESEENLIKKSDTLNYSPILNVYLLLKQNPFREKFYGFIDSPVHWLFNHGKYISLVSSAAENLIGLDYKVIIRHFCTEIQNYFPFFDCNTIIDSKIIKEKRATFIPDNDSIKIRKTIVSPFENLVFAGDWTVTDLPSTIESAVLSARYAAERLLGKT